MRRFFTTALALCVLYSVNAQDTTLQTTSTPTAVPKRKLGAVPGGNDHFMIQLGYTSLQGKPDSIRTSGFSRSFNMYFMFAFPFRTNPKLSVALGPGIASDHIFFDRTDVRITDIRPTLEFRNVSDTNYFKKYKVATSWLEVPVELRFSSKPFDDKRSFKVAIGAKIATLLSAWTKKVELANRAGQTINDFTEKEKSKRFFNTNRLSVMGRIGYGHFTLFTSYSITPMFKEGTAAIMRPWTIGLTLSGL